MSGIRPDPLGHDRITFLVENVEAFLSPSGENGTELFGRLKSGSSDQSFSFSEAGCFQTSSKKVISCNFSSDGKFLASAGHEKKVVLWEMESLKHWSSKEEHSSIITDICFRPGTMQLATASTDATVRLWDAASEICKLHSFRGGHNSRITSLDFHPKKTDILCSCDVNGQILFWSCTAPYGCSRISKDATDTISKVRFQPKLGQFLAAASENAVAIHDIETNKKITTIPGHDNVLKSICWHDNGDYIAGVSQDCGTVWSISSGKCIHQFSSKGNQFRSCVFHPIYKNLLIIGGYQTLQLWNMAEQRIVDIKAHADLIVDLASSTEGLISSVSHDFSVKIWR